MIIDGHAHAAGDFLKADNIVKVLDENNVDCIVLAGTVEINSSKNQNLNYFSKLAEKHPKGFIFIINKITKLINSLAKSATKVDLGNEYVYQLVKQYPNRILQFYWIDPCENGIIDKIKVNYEKYKFRGIKLHQCINKFSLKEKYMDDISEWCEENEIPIFIHLCSKEDVVDMIQLIRNHKNTKYIIAHLIGVEMFIDAGMDFPNVFFDISCPALVPKNKILLAIDKFGAEKITMGSDTPYGNNNLKNALNNVQELGLPESQKKLILGENMQKLLNLH